MIISIPTLESLPGAVDKFLQALGDRKVVAFYAPMGAGKTTFIAALCRRLGVEETAASPSFAIINEYMARPSSLPVYHFDFYRLDSPADAMEIGAEDYFYSGNLCLIEWPERIESILPEDTVKVSIRADENSGERTLYIDEE